MIPGEESFFWPGCGHIGDLVKSENALFFFFSFEVLFIEQTV